jgi:hypothetical protein
MELPGVLCRFVSAKDAGADVSDRQRVAVECSIGDISLSVTGRAFSPGVDWTD